tara:strand:+ start:3378 stop:3899 length:522 start_codon:yes stop_codon:yes gene_type:complete
MSCDHPVDIIAKDKVKHKKKIDKAKEVIKEFNPKTIESGTYLYAILKDKPNKIIITSNKNEKNQYKIKHHVLAGDKNVVIAGDLKVVKNDKGETFSFDNNSGHYKPDADCLEKLEKVADKKYNLKKIGQSKKTLKTGTFPILKFEKKKTMVLKVKKKKVVKKKPDKMKLSCDC